MLERARFIEDYLSGFYSITELANRYGVSRRTLHKWLGRHDVAGANGLVDHSRAPLHSPHRTSDDLAARIVAFRKRFPFMGPRKRRPCDECARSVAKSHDLDAGELLPESRLRSTRWCTAMYAESDQEVCPELHRQGRGPPLGMSQGRPQRPAPRPRTGRRGQARRRRSTPHPGRDRSRQPRGTVTSLAASGFQPGEHFF